MHSLKEKLTWLLKDGFLMDKKMENRLAYGLDLETNTFYAISFTDIGLTSPKRVLETKNLPLLKIDKNMDVFVDY